MSAVAEPLSRAAVNAKSIALISTAAVAFGVFLSGFVIREPAPYELYMAGLIAVWALFGLRISRSIVPLLVLLVAFNIGGMISTALTPSARRYGSFLAARWNVPTCSSVSGLNVPTWIS